MLILCIQKIPTPPNPVIATRKGLMHGVFAQNYKVIWVVAQETCLFVSVR